MQLLNRVKQIVLVLSLFITLVFPIFAGATVCSDGVAEPQFLSVGVDPNLLLIIDNSGSMYDMAYVDDLDFCVDESYADNATYSGYFGWDGGDTYTADNWYSDNVTTDKFQLKSEADAKLDCSATCGDDGIECYTNSYLCVTIDTAETEAVSDDELVAFAATANFLNWGLSSKFDVEKQILTGGKYDEDNSTLVLEGRGCSNRRFVKQVDVTDESSEDMKFTMAIRPPDQDFTDADDTVRIDFFPVTDIGFDDTSCQLAVTELQKDSPNLGQLKVYIDDCLAYERNLSDDILTASNGAFNQSTQTCWYITKHPAEDDEDEKVTHVTSIQNACELLYENGVNPASINPYEQSYVCAGILDNVSVGSYVGRCWDLGYYDDNCSSYTCDNYDDDDDDGTVYAGPIPVPELQTGEEEFNNPFCRDELVYYCTGNFTEKSGNCSPSTTWTVERYPNPGHEGEACATEGTDSGWSGTDDEIDECIYDALLDYCGMLDVPEVIDPTDLTSQTSEFWNLPAVLIDSGVISQLGEPLATLMGVIDHPETPTGLLQEKSSEIRIGAMAFNTEGSASECEDNDKVACIAGSNLDGAQILTDIGIDSLGSTTHIDGLVSSINDIKARTWTPLAESMYNAIGYYSANATRRINDGNATLEPDFDVANDPITDWCQSNYVLIITEGASTTDLNAEVQAFVDTENDGNDDDNVTCGELSGSTNLDDLTYFANTSPNLHTTQLNDEDKRKITTFVVASGTLRDIGTDDECNPVNLLENAAINGGSLKLYTSDNSTSLRDNLEQILGDISTRSSSGSAASVISSSRGGEGAMYQAIFWPEVERDELPSVTWVGEVHSLFVNALGHMYEDSDGDGILDDTQDNRVWVFFDQNLRKSVACYSQPVTRTILGDEMLQCDSDNDLGTAENIEVNDINYLWSANNWLSKVENYSWEPALDPDTSNISDNRVEDFHLYDPDDNDTYSNYISGNRQRHIFTWNDLDNDGIVDNQIFVDSDDNTTETFGFVESFWQGAEVKGGRGDINSDFNTSDNATLNNVIKWIRGDDNETIMRGRTIDNFDLDGTDSTITWRLGDVINSTPMVVSSPQEGFHLIYKDISYTDFVHQYQNRRHMVYFGANDGMLHAVNSGFFSKENGQARFCRTDDCSVGGNDIVSDVPELGAELWAYVPYNLQPHLQCLTNKDYAHKYYVDQRPRIFDVRIFKDDADHPNGWGTILVGSMRLGGYPVTAASLNGDATDTREFTSAYFIMDITNPEKPPILLGEFTRKTDGNEIDLGYTTAIPTLVVMKDGDETDDYYWYLILGSGPHGDNAIQGESDQAAQIGVLPLNWLSNRTGQTRIPFRIPNTVPDAASSDGGTFTVGDGSIKGLVSDLITLDYDLEANYMADAVYFGTVDGNATSGYGGRMFRLVTREEDAGNQVEIKPRDWDTDTMLGGVSGDNPALLHDAGAPIVAAPTVGKGPNNFWVYFGTGHFFGDNDKSDASEQYYYGIKEPTIGCLPSPTFTWEEVEKIGTVDGTPGGRGLLKVDQIKIRYNISPELCCSDDNSTNSCDIADDSCFPTNVIDHDVTTYDQLRDYIAGNTCPDDVNDANDNDGTDGWYRKLLLPRERNLGQASLLGGLLTYTSYQPFDDNCKAEGLSYLYGLYYQTGTAWNQPIFGDYDELIDPLPEYISLGTGLTLTPNLHVGAGEGPTAFVQTSTGEIIEIPQINLPVDNFKAGRAKWRDRACD